MRVLYTFEVFRGKKKKFYWRAVAGNGKTVADSGEGYNRKGPCMRFVKNIQSLNPERIRIKDLT